MVEKGRAWTLAPGCWCAAEFVEAADELERDSLWEKGLFGAVLRQRGAVKARLTPAQATLLEREAVRIADVQALGLTMQEEAIEFTRSREHGKGGRIGASNRDVVF